MAKPKLALIPSAQGSKLYSVLPSSGVGDFNFTRSGSATRINSQGLIESVASGVSRLNYPMIDGVVNGCPHHILEPQRSNLLSYSEQFDNSSWGKARLSISANQVISPDGTLSADYIEQQSGNTVSGGVFKGATFLASTYTQSAFVKKKEKGFIALVENASSPSLRYTWFDIENGLIGTVNGGHTAKIEYYGNDWYRCSITYTAINTGSGFSSFYYLADTDNSTIVTGSGGLYIWGAMLEEGSYPTSYIPTTTAAVTRSAETATGSGDASTFNDSEGVLMAEISALVNDGSIRYLQIHNSQNTSQRLFLRYDNAGNRIKVSYINGSAIYTATYDDFNITDYNKISFKWSNSDFNLYVNGFKVDEQLSGSTGNLSLDSLDFKQFTGSFPFYGNTKQLQYFDTALTNSELETLTSWVSFQDMAEGQLYTIE
jgi:hypothetical protein